MARLRGVKEPPCKHHGKRARLDAPSPPGRRRSARFQGVTGPAFPIPWERWAYSMLMPARNRAKRKRPVELSVHTAR
jgi:hypothetical protein